MDEDERIEHAIEKAVQAVSDLKEADHRLIEERIERLMELVEKHEHTLYGNGKIGLTSVVDRLERVVTEAQTIITKLVTTLIIAGVIGLIVLLVENGFLKP